MTKFHFSFKIDFYPTIMEEGTSINLGDVLVPERMALFTKDINATNKNIYYVRIRGVPYKNCLNFLETINEVIGS